MADGKVEIETKLDTSGVDKGVNDLKKQLDGAAKSANGATGKIKSIDNALGKFNKSNILAAAGIGATAAAIKKTVDALDECEVAYKTQIKAEKALTNAAKNNPYLNEESVYNLKNYASELQQITEIGDEQTLQVMAQLASMGRTEEQIRQIMSAAADMSAVTGNSIQNIAIQLNKTFSGLAGELGEANSAVRALTTSELESGKAIEIIANQYKGQAASMADINVQLSNSWGDFKENIGRGWSKVTQPVKEFFLGVLNDINEATAKTNALNDAAVADETGKATISTSKILLDEAQKKLAQLEKIDTIIKKIRADSEGYKQLTEQELDEYTQYTVKNTNEQHVINLREARAEVERLTIQYGRLSAAEKKEADEKSAAAAAAQKAADAEKRNQQAAEYIDANKKALADQIAALALKSDITGKAIDAQEVYNLYMQSYIDLITKSNGLVTENNAAAKERIELLQQAAQAAAEYADKADKADKAMSAAEGFGNNTYWDNYINHNEELLQMIKDINAAEVEDEERKADALKKIDEEIAQNRKNLVANLATEINGYIQQTAQVINDAAALALEAEKNRMQAELDDLETKYKKGELSEEEYQKKVAEAKKKGAEKQYQIEMAQWSANILAATANTAVGVTQALAQGGVAGIITGALVAAAGAVQLASIIAAKPQKHFASGGFVGGMNGASMGADNTTIAARNGELVVNANQQRRMWELLNGTDAAGSGGVNIVVNNKASNIVRTRQNITRDQIEIMIDERVNESLRNGRYNDGLNAAQAGMSGAFYGM